MDKTTGNDFVPKINYFIFRKCTPSWNLRPHLVRDNDLTYVIKGNARYIIDDEVYELKPGDLLCLKQSMEKKAVTYPKSLMHCYAVNFQSLYPTTKDKAPDFPIKNHIGMRKEIIDLFRELALSWSRQENGYKMNTRALLMLILHRLSEILIYNKDSQIGFNIISGKTDARINKTINTIALRYSEKMTVKFLAGQVNLNEAYFGRLFERETGMTVNQYIMKIRLRNAENLLQTGNYKIHEVADMCGFCDVVHFYKSFKNWRGLPPSRCKLKIESKKPHRESDINPPPPVLPHLHHLRDNK